MALPPATYVELVGSLFETLLPTAIMAMAFIAVGIIIASQTPDPLISFLTGAGSIAVAARLVVLLAYRRPATAESLDFETARIFERRFALPYFCFAVALGAFAARAFVVATPEAHMLVVGLLFGYGAGVAAGLALRPWISVPCVLLAVTPTVIVTALSSNHIYWAVGALLTVFLGGGIQSMLVRYRLTAKRISMRRLMSTLAHADDLTGLPNRLALRERFEEAVIASGMAPRIAVHCLDLDRFKAVNDRYGHPIGDALLAAVSERMTSQLRRGDFVARTGGDEFVIVQPDISHPGEAELLARRIARSVAQPFSIGHITITIGTSIGYALSSEHGTELDRLVACADDALVRVKGAGGGVLRYQPPGAEPEIRLSA